MLDLEATSLGVPKMAPPSHGHRPIAVQTPVAYVVVFSELSPRAKTQYARFLVENNVQFAKRPSDGRFVANIHLETSPAVKEAPATSNEKPPLQPASPRALHPVEARGAYLSEDESSDDEALTPTQEEKGLLEPSESGGTPVQLQRYSAFLDQFGSGVSSRQCTGTYTIESKLVRLMSDIYDARSDEYTPPTDASDHEESPPLFALFVRGYLKKRFGLKTLVEQQALELAEGLAAHSTRLDVELFSRFLEGEYDEATLSFFLRTRETAQQEVSASSALFRPTSAASARRRGSDSSSRRRRPSATTTAISSAAWLSKQQIESVAQRMFGARNDDNFLQFVHNVRSFVVENPTTRSMEKLLELSEFLTVTVETFVNSQPLPASAQSESLSSTSKHAHDGQEDLADSCYSPSPSPLPPPPLPRDFGSTVSIASKTTSRSIQVTNMATRLSTAQLVRAPPTQPPVTVSDIIIAPAAFQTSGQTERPKKPQGDEVESRLSSLLARMQQRQLQGDA